MDFTPFQSYIKQSTLVSLDVYPTYVFSKIGSGMGGVSVLPISTMLQVGQTLLETVVTTNFLVANQCKIVIDSETFIDGSNVYQTPIRLHIPKSTITTFASTYTLVHKMPSALLSNVQQNGLNDANIGVYFDTSRGIEISIQNIPGQ
jgi:hypothetical protein